MQEKTDIDERIKLAAKKKNVPEDTYRELLSLDPKDSECVYFNKKTNKYIQEQDELEGFEQAAEIFDKFVIVYLTEDDGVKIWDI